MSTVQFSGVGMEILSSLVHFFGVSIVSYMLALKLTPSDITSFTLRHMTCARSLVLLNLIDSWAFLFLTGVLIHGAGMELSGTVCLLGILNCIIFYSLSKILIYLFLAEKVLVVWNPFKRRFQSKVYLGCLAALLIYLGVVIYMILGRIALFRDDGACVIGLTRSASLALLIYDLCINVLLTSLFVWPLLKRDFATNALRAVAIRTLWAAGVALTTSCINILVLTIMHGRELAWVCLASCGTDVVINALVLCWVTSGQHDRGSQPRDSHVHTSSKYSATASTDTAHCDQPPSIHSRFSKVFPHRSRVPSMSMSLPTHNCAPVPEAEVEVVPADQTDMQAPRVSFGSDCETLSSPISPVPEQPTGNGIEEEEIGATPVLRTPLLAYSSPMTRSGSNTLLSRHSAAPTAPGGEPSSWHAHPPTSSASSPTARSSQGTRGLEITVTRETDVLTDAVQPAPRSARERRARRCPGSSPGTSMNALERRWRV
ncbi:hypothetical protein K466DRAFT_666784 [Polyporus arcularius HHB13444]|uniref:Uncharacterized protein n=1 Tax=Polyporus arcularius HHB13444 TaxID=1314778 RepID=A0A5C3NYZ2_9APHY|nr:hypothetical protein K466DRAFT_666784 [Polyporus arcularius HHB13444]